MTIQTFKESVEAGNLPPDVSLTIKALWYDATGDWHKAHECIQDRTDNDAAWIHAYLHRKEGDTGNADYWYLRAGRRRPEISLTDEWEQILAALI